MLKFFNLWIVFLFFIFNAIYAATPDSVFYAKAIQFEKEIIFDSAAYYYSKQANVFRRQRAYVTADSIYDIAISLFNSDKKLTDKTILINVLIDKSYNKSVQGDFIGRRDCLIPVIDICKDTSYHNEKIGRFGYHYLGNIYTRLGDYERALILFKQARAIYKKHESRERLAIIANDIAIIQSDQGNHDKAISILNEGLTVPNIDQEIKGLLFTALSQEYQYLDQSDSMLFYINQAVSIYNKLLQTKDPRGRILNWGYQVYAIAGAVYSDQEKYVLAEEYFKKSISLGLNVFGGDGTRREFAKLYTDYGDMLLKTEQYEAALKKYHQALAAVIPNISVNNIHQLPSEDQLYSENSIMDALLGKIRIYQKFYELDNDIKWQQRALQSCDLVLKVEKLIWGNYTFDSSKLLQLSQNKEISEKAINTAYELFLKTGKQNYIEQAFQYAEKRKSTLLLEAIRQNILVQFSPQQSNFFQQEKTLRVQRNAFKIRLFELEQAGVDKNSEEWKKYVSLEAATAQEIALLDNRIKVKSLKGQATENLEYRSIKYLQKYFLQNDSLAIIEYFYGENYIFAFKIVKNEPATLVRIPLTDGLRLEISSFLTFFQSPNAISNDLNRYTQFAFGLYQKLFAKLNIKKGMEVILIPDDQLSFLPFEALLTKRHNIKQYQNAPFLLFQNHVRYAYSVPLLLNISSSKNTASNNMLIMAPIFENRERGLSTLEYSYKEIDQFKFIKDAVTLTSEAATLENFLSIAPQSKVIYLSTHGYEQSQNVPPHIEFYDRSLYLPELYNMDLSQCELVVLSACETSLGEVKKGEGVMSLARGFTYTRAKSLISSLWSVNEASTAKLFNYFSSHIKNKKSKAQSLYHSKIDYIGDLSLRSIKRSPYYWAGFNFTGQDGTLDFQQQPSLFKSKTILIFMSLCLCLLIFFLWRKFFA